MPGGSGQHTCAYWLLLCAYQPHVSGYAFLGKLPRHVLQGPKDPAIPPMELTFMETYGPMTQHLWFGDGYIMLGFRLVCCGSAVASRGALVMSCVTWHGLYAAHTAFSCNGLGSITSTAACVVLGQSLGATYGGTIATQHCGGGGCLHWGSLQHLHQAIQPCGLHESQTSCWLPLLRRSCLPAWPVLFCSV